MPRMPRTARRHLLVLALATALLTSGVIAATVSAVAPGTAVPAALTRVLRHANVSTAPGRLVPGSAHSAQGGTSRLAYYNWSGYADDDTAANTYSSATGTWKQPKVTCPADEDRIAVWWVGFDGLNNGTVEQAGTLASCHHGTASYSTWWEMYPTNGIQVVGTTVAPGDTIVTTIGFAGGDYTLTVSDTTQPASSFTKVTQCDTAHVTCANASAEWIAEAVGTSRGYQPWPKFGPWKVAAARATSGTTNGTITSFPADEITMVGSDSLTTLGTPTALNAPGNSFRVAWNYAWA
jgi:Peptidase A4 family